MIFAIFLSLNFVSAGYYYNFEIKYDKGDLKINSIDVEFSQEDNFADNYYNEENIYYIDSS